MLKSGDEMCVMITRFNDSKRTGLGRYWSAGSVDFWVKGGPQIPKVCWVKGGHQKP
jgi:hypothetical protein